MFNNTEAFVNLKQCTNVTSNGSSVAIKKMQCPITFSSLLGGNPFLNHHPIGLVVLDPYRPRYGNKYLP